MKTKYYWCWLILQESSDLEHKVPPSPVVHVRGLPEHVTENDLREAVINFGIVRYVYSCSGLLQVLICVVIQMPDKPVNCITVNDIFAAVPE